MMSLSLTYYLHGYVDQPLQNKTIHSDAFWAKQSERSKN